MLPNLSALSGPTAIPDGGTAHLCGPSGNYTYQWSTGATTPCINVSQLGTYTLVVQDAVTLCASPPCSVTIR